MITLAAVRLAKRLPKAKVVRVGFPNSQPDGTRMIDCIKWRAVDLPENMVWSSDEPID